MSILYPSPDLRPYAITGSNTFIANQTVTGSVFVSSSLSASAVSGSDATFRNLTVNGTTTTIDTVNLTVKDNLIEINKSSPAVPSLGAGFVISGSGGNIFITASQNGSALAINTSLTASSLSGAAVYGLSGAAAQFPRFQTDVRAQFSQGTGITINNGVISASAIPNSSLANTGSILGSTPIILGTTPVTTVAGLTSLTSTTLSGTNLITGSTISASIGVSGGLGRYGALTGSSISSSNYIGLRATLPVAYSNNVISLDPSTFTSSVQNAQYDTNTTDIYFTNNNGINTYGPSNTIYLVNPLSGNSANVNRYVEINVKDASSTQKGVVTTTTQDFTGNKLFYKGCLFADASTLPYTYYAYSSTQIHRDKNLFNDPKSGHLVISQPEHESVIGSAAQLYFGLYGTTANNSYSWVQSANSSFNTMKYLQLNPSGGYIGINKVTNLPNAQLDVNGNTIITGSLTVGVAGTVEGTVTLNKVFNANSDITYQTPASVRNVAMGFYTSWYHNFYNGSTLVAKIGRNSSFAGLYNELSCSGYINYVPRSSAGSAVYRDAEGYLTNTSSDIRLKKNIINIDNALEKIINLNGVYFNWTKENDSEFNSGDESIRNIGFIAQEVEKILPEAVCFNGIKDYKTVKYAELTSVLVEGIKELKKENDELKQTLKNVLERLSALEDK